MICVVLMCFLLLLLLCIHSGKKRFIFHLVNKDSASHEMNDCELLLKLLKMKSEKKKKAFVEMFAL